MLEALVFSVCMAGAACGQATKAYYESTPTLQNVARGSKEYAVRRLGKEAMTVLPAAAALAAGMPPQIKINRNFSLTGKEGQTMLIFNGSF